MWREKLLTLWSNSDKKLLLPIVLLVLGFILLGYGLIQSLRPSDLGQASQDITFESAQNPSENKSSQKIVVDIEGAVVNPGVYTLDAQSRVKDVLVLAGGLSSQADRQWVEKNINLASKLTDGAKIYIPRAGEVGSARLQGSGSFSSGLININSASPSQLDSLPGIGPVTAQKIIDNRPYASIDELLAKKIVSAKTFEKIKEKISVY